MNSNARLAAFAVTLVCLALGLSACTSTASGGQDEPTDSPTPSTGPGEPTETAPELPDGPIGELAATWSEADAEWVTEVDAPVLLTSGWHLDHWLQGVPDDLPDRDLLTSIDFATNALVIGAYPRCTETSAVYIEPAGTTGSIARFAVEDAEDDTVCVWSPVTVDVWVLPQGQTGDRAPVALSTSAAPEHPADADEVGTLLHSWQQGNVTSADMAQVMARYAGLISDTGRRDAFVRDLGADLGFGGSALTEIAELDLDSNALVVTSYWQCTEASSVYADTSRDPTLLWIEISVDQDVDCDWSPYTIDVFQVPHTRTGQQMELGQYLPFATA